MMKCEQNVFCDKTEGQGQEGHFGGFATELSEATVVILPIPFDLTTSYQQGTSEGPSAIIEASRYLELYDTETDSSAFEVGIHTAQPIQAKSCEEMIDAVKASALAYLQKDKFVAGLGGEHSVSYPLIAAHVEHYPGLSILQFDAHSDLRDSYEGNPYSHASVMARVQDLPDVGNIVSVGVRSMCLAEKARVSNTYAFFSHLLDPLDIWMQNVLSKLNENVYITFDLDAFDSSIMPSTGTPEPGGINWHQATKLLNLVAKHKNIVGCDIVELLPLPGLKAPDFLAAKLLYKILSYKYSSKPSSKELS